MTNATIRRVIILGALAIVSLLAVQTYWVLRTWNLQETEFNRKVYLALQSAALDMQNHYQFELPVNNLIEQLHSNYYVVNINQVFDAPVLEYYLQKSLEKQGLHEDFQYGIFDCSSNQMVTGKLIQFRKVTGFGQSKVLPEQLPPHTDSDFIYYFGIRFPQKNANILSNMWIVVVFTALMLVTVAFFIYSMAVILRQKRLSELQRDFINNMTHEFKTPISTINVSTDVFLKSELVQADARLNRYAGIIKEQVLRLNNQVEKVLQLAKIERNTLELNIEEVNLSEMIDSILPSIELKAQEREGGKLTLLNEADRALIRADRLHLANILHNLVDNAVKYSKGAPNIVVRLFNDQNQLVLQVKDKGIGIAKEYQKRVFDKFYRVPTGNVHNVKGFGLGLFYVKNMCREHHWKLLLDSQPGQGTTVEIRMPLA